MPLHFPPNEGPIRELYAWLSVDETGEGVIAAPILDGVTSLIFGKREIAERFREVAYGMSMMAGKRCRLVRYAVAETVEEIGTQ